MTKYQEIKNKQRVIANYVIKIKRLLNFSVITNLLPGKRKKSFVYITMLKIKNFQVKKRKSIIFCKHCTKFNY